MSEPTYSDGELMDAAVTALLRRLQTAGIERGVVADMTDQEQAEVFAAEARNRNRRR